MYGVSKTRQLTLGVLVYLAVAVMGFIGGGLLLYVVKVRSGPGLEVWHTTKLSAEFTEGMAGREIADFRGYLRLEDLLFRQLDEEVYDRVATGQEQALVRYSTGSLADPRTWDRDWNRSFILEAEPAAGSVLLLHGMSDSPYSLRALGEALHGRGYRVLGLRLPGHGTAPSGLLDTTWRDMAAAVRLAADHLAPGPLHIVGYSTGAPLAVNYTLDAMKAGDGASVPASLVLVSPSMGITPFAALAKWKGRLAKLSGLAQLAWTDILPEFDPFKYNSFTANAGAQVHALTRNLAFRIRDLAAAGPIEGFPPTLAFLSTVDATVSTGAVVDTFMRFLAPGSHELVLFDVNRRRLKATIMVADPGPMTVRLLADETLPVALTVIRNQNLDTEALAVVRWNPLTGTKETEPVDATWPRGVISLSHVALPFAPDDPLYGRREYAPEGRLHLGQIDLKGERNLLKFPADWLLRLRHNPFYHYLENRSLEWMAESQVKDRP